MIDKLLQDISRYLILYRAEEYSTERPAKEILAKLKAMYPIMYREEADLVGRYILSGLQR